MSIQDDKDSLFANRKRFTSSVYLKLSFLLGWDRHPKPLQLMNQPMSCPPRSWQLHSLRGSQTAIASTQQTSKARILLWRLPRNPEDSCLQNQQKLLRITGCWLQHLLSGQGQTWWLYSEYEASALQSHSLSVPDQAPSRYLRQLQKQQIWTGSRKWKGRLIRGRIALENVSITTSTSEREQYHWKFGGQFNAVNRMNWKTGVQLIVYADCAHISRNAGAAPGGAHISLVCLYELCKNVAGRV